MGLHLQILNFKEIFDSKCRLNSAVTTIKMPHCDEKVNQTNIRASPAAVPPPALRSNRTHREEKHRLKTRKQHQSFIDLVKFKKTRDEKVELQYQSKYFIIVWLLGQTH